MDTSSQPEPPQLPDAPTERAVPVVRQLAPATGPARTKLLEEARQLEWTAVAAAERAETQRRLLETLSERHRHYAALLRRNYPGALPQQLVAAIVEGQPTRRITLLEWAMIKAEVLRPVYLAALNQLVGQIEQARQEWQAALAQERELLQKAAALRRQAGTSRARAPLEEVRPAVLRALAEAEAAVREAERVLLGRLPATNTVSPEELPEALTGPSAAGLPRGVPLRPAGARHHSARRRALGGPPPGA